MTLDELTVNFSHLNRKRLLSDWEWLIGKGKLPILLTAGGNAFVQDTGDNSVHFLDTTWTQLSKIAEDPEEFRQLLRNKEFVETYLSVPMISDLVESGLRLNKGEIYSFQIPLALGGKGELSNVEANDIEVHFSIAGQLQHQCKDLPEGTPIRNIKLALKPRAKKWWQVWA